MTGGDGIFMIQSGKLVVLHDAPYETENVLQEALARFPEVLAGGTTTDDGDRRLLLISREKGTATKEGGSATFSLDHLFVDHTGVPVVVEVKRSTDTRIRREVVGQMLDYAANGVKYWPIAELRADFERNCAVHGVEPDQLIEDVASGLAPEEFWKQFEQNLRSGRVRLVFVADRLPDELVRIIEFLNEQMTPAEVLGVEVQQFTDGDTKVLVPRLIGATSAAKATKERAGGTAWTEDSMLDAARDRCSAAEIETLKALLHHATESGTRLSWGKGLSPAVSAWYLVNGASRPVWQLSFGTGTGSSKAHLALWHNELTADLGAARYASLVLGLRSIEAFRRDSDANAHKYPYAPLAELSTDDLPTFFRLVQGLADTADEPSPTAGGDQPVGTDSR